MPYRSEWTDPEIDNTPMPRHGAAFLTAARSQEPRRRFALSLATCDHHVSQWPLVADWSTLDAGAHPAPTPVRSLTDAAD